MITSEIPGQWTYTRLWELQNPHRCGLVEISRPRYALYVEEFCRGTKTGQSCFLYVRVMRYFQLDPSAELERTHPERLDSLCDSEYSFHCKESFDKGYGDSEREMAVAMNVSCFSLEWVVGCLAAGAQRAAVICLFENCWHLIIGFLCPKAVLPRYIRFHYHTGY